MDGVRVWQLLVQVRSRLHRRRPACTRPRTESWKCCSVDQRQTIGIPSNVPRWAQKQLILATIFARPGRAAVSSKPDARDTVKWLTMPVYGLIDRPRATLQRLLQRRCMRSFSFLHLVVLASSLLVLSSSSLLSSARGVRVLQHVCAAFFSLFYWLSVGGTGSRRAAGPDDRPSAGRSSFFLLLTRTVYNSPWRQFSFSRQASQWLVGAMDIRDSTQTGRTWGRPSTHRRSTTANRLSKFSCGERIQSETDGSAIFMLRQGVAKTLYCNRLFFVFSKKP